MEEDLLELIKEIYRNGPVCLDFVQEHYPELFFKAHQRYGSLKNAVETAGIKYGKFLSGFDMESSLYLNRKFIRTVIPILRNTGVVLESQTQISFVEDRFDPLRIDQNKNWYIIKILPWSELIQYLIPQIIPFTESPITIIYLKKERNLPTLDLIVFKNFEDYLKPLPPDDPAIYTIKILKNVVNATKIVIR
ncbi:MAG: hypothetical protein LUQ65_13900 [Candidatus Helarchaeota archaeon]|nr:hypothetical protein [Candidatus Helarchaeota archaeon]